MVILDANLLIYAYTVDSPFHERASMWLDDLFASGVEVGLPMQVVLAFIRISANPKISSNSVSISDAIEIVHEWLGLPQVEILGPQHVHWEVFARLCKEVEPTGDLLTDVHIAALAIEYEAMLFSADRDFARFPGLRWVNPLAAK